MMTEAEHLKEILAQPLAKVEFRHGANPPVEDLMVPIRWASAAEFLRFVKTDPCNFCFDAADVAALENAINEEARGRAEADAIHAEAEASPDWPTVATIDNRGLRHRIIGEVTERRSAPCPN